MNKLIIGFFILGLASAVAAGRNVVIPEMIPNDFLEKLLTPTQQS